MPHHRPDRTIASFEATSRTVPSFAHWVPCGRIGSSTHSRCAASSETVEARVGRQAYERGCQGNRGGHSLVRSDQQLEEGADGSGRWLIVVIVAGKTSDRNDLNGKCKGHGLPVGRRPWAASACVDAGTGPLVVLLHGSPELYQKYGSRRPEGVRRSGGLDGLYLGFRTVRASLPRLVHWSGSRWRTESSGRPRSRILMTRPCSAAWSATGPAITV
jgi:hypothetical protein